MHHKIFLASHVQPLIEAIRELNAQAAASSGCGRAGNPATLNRLQAMAAVLEKGAHTLAIGLHTHASGVSPYAFAVGPGVGFGEEDLEQYLEDTFEPHKDEFLDVFYPDEIEVLAAGADQECEAPSEAFLNQYACPRCDAEWEMKWSCRCDEDCPECGTVVTAADDD